MVCHSKSLSLQSIRLSTTIYVVLSQGRVSLEQRLGTALQTAILLIISLSLCCFSNPTYLTTEVYYTTHTLVGCRASPPQGWEVYSTIWLSIV